MNLDHSWKDENGTSNIFLERNLKRNKLAQNSSDATIYTPGKQLRRTIVQS
jgi:hypothetical protein